MLISRHRRYAASSSYCRGRSGKHRPATPAPARSSQVTWSSTRGRDRPACTHRLTQRRLAGPQCWPCPALCASQSAEQASGFEERSHLHVATVAVSEQLVGCLLHERCEAVEARLTHELQQLLQKTIGPSRQLGGSSGTGCTSRNARGGARGARCAGTADSRAGAAAHLFVRGRRPIVVR